MVVKYEFEIKKWNDFIDLKTVVQNYNGEMPKFTSKLVHGELVRYVQIPYSRGYDFEEKLKQFADVEYQIVRVMDVPMDEDNRVIDGTHKDFDKEDWK